MFFLKMNENYFRGHVFFLQISWKEKNITDVILSVTRHLRAGPELSTFYTYEIEGGRGSQKCRKSHSFI